jgi:hypothetical protein
MEANIRAIFMKELNKVREGMNGKMVLSNNTLILLFLL